MTEPCIFAALCSRSWPCSTPSRLQQRHFGKGLQEPPDDGAGTIREGAIWLPGVTRECQHAECDVSSDLRIADCRAALPAPSSHEGCAGNPPVQWCASESFISVKRHCFLCFGRCFDTAFMATPFALRTSLTRHVALRPDPLMPQRPYLPRLTPHTPICPPPRQSFA